METNGYSLSELQFSLIISPFNNETNNSSLKL